MRARLFLILGLIITLSACKAHYPTPQQSGKDDVAYLLFVGNDKYHNQKVNVSVNDKKPFEAQVVMEKISKRKGTAYTISTGRKKICVEFNGQIIYNKEIFASPQETKIITLP